MRFKTQPHGAVFLGLAVLAALLSPATAQDKIPDAVKKAQAKLETAPDDAEANMTVGKYLLDKGDWEKGLACLGKSGDAVLKPVVDRDAQAPKDAAEQIKLGDAWLEAGEKRSGFKARSIERALYWFQKAWAFVDGKDKETLRRIFYKITPPPVGYDKPGKSQETAIGWGTQEVNGTFIDPTFARSGKRSLRLVQPKGKKYSGVDVSPFPVPPGRKYQITAWVYTDKTEADGKIQFRAHGKDNPNALMQKDFTIPQDSPFWQKITAEVEVPADAFRVLFYIDNNSTTGGQWVDDISLVADGKDYMKNGGFEDKK